MVQPPCPEDLRDKVLAVYENVLHPDVRKCLGLESVAFDIFCCNTFEEILSSARLIAVYSASSLTVTRRKRVTIVDPGSERIMLKIFFGALDLLHFSVLNHYLNSAQILESEEKLVTAVLRILDQLIDPTWGLILDHSIADTKRSNAFTTLFVRRKNWFWRKDDLQDLSDTLPIPSWSYVKSDPPHYKQSFESARQRLKPDPEHTFGGVTILFARIAQQTSAQSGQTPTLDYTMTDWLRGMPPLQDLYGERPYILNCSVLTLWHEFGHLFRSIKGRTRPYTLDKERDWGVWLHQARIHWYEIIAAAIAHEYAPHLINFDRQWDIAQSELPLTQQPIMRTQMDLYAPADVTTMVLRRADSTDHHIYSPIPPVTAPIPGFDMLTTRLVHLYQHGKRQKLWTSVEEFFEIFVSNTGENAVRDILGLPLRWGHD